MGDDGRLGWAGMTAVRRDWLASGYGGSPSSGQPPASRSIRAAMMKSLRESPRTEWVVRRTTRRPQATSSSGWWFCDSASKAIRVARPNAALNVLKVNSRRISAPPTFHSDAMAPASRRASSLVSGGVPARSSAHRSRPSDSGVIGSCCGSLMSERIPSGPREVLRVGDLVAPFALGSVCRSLPDGEVGHEVVGRSAVPVPLAGRCVDRVPGSDLDDFAAAGLDAPDTLGHVDRLTDGMGVPRVSGTWRKANHADADARRLLAARDDVEPDVSGEGVGAGLHGRLFGLDLHRWSPSGAWSGVHRERGGKVAVGFDVGSEIGDLLRGGAHRVHAGNEAPTRLLFARQHDQGLRQLGRVPGLLAALRIPPLELLRAAVSVVLDRGLSVGR